LQSYFHALVVSSDPVVELPVVVEDNFIRAADVSFLPEIESSGTIFYNNAKAQDMLTTLKMRAVIR
jgi:arabinogalactan endo-1,4-beta-galactosidase